MMPALALAVQLLFPATAADPPAYPNPNLLVEVEDLKPGKFHLLDVRGKANYEAGHVPGAVLAEYGPWSKALTEGRADAAFWKRELAAVGVRPGRPVVVYSDDVRNAARVWWMLKLAGVPDVRILNGGWKAYTAAKLPEQKEPVTVRAEPHDWKPDPARLATKADVLAELKQPGATIVDARTREEFTGEQKAAKKAGHIPGAVHLEWSDLLDPRTGKFLPPDELKKLAADRKIDPGKRAITYCQSGGRAAVTAFGLELLGAKDVRNYYRSWSEWGNAEDTPVATPPKK
jgi:thiosulfate/3-mercaptopyruvate sulfurtransferase